MYDIASQLLNERGKIKALECVIFMIDIFYFNYK